MKCLKCGAENPEGKKLCGDCGAPLPRPELLEQKKTKVLETEVAQGIGAEKKQSSRRRKFFILGISLIVVIVIGCGLAVVLTKLPSRIESKKTKEKPSAEFVEQRKKLRVVGNKLLAGSEAIKHGKTDYIPVDDYAKEVQKPASFLKNYIEEHPSVEGGADTLVQIADTYGLIDDLIGGKQQKLAETYYLLIDLYPKDKEVPKAKKWLRANGYDVD